jgi:DNA replication protein DnaC
MPAAPELNDQLTGRRFSHVRPDVMSSGDCGFPLLLGELGHLPVVKRGADPLFQVVAAHDEAGSTGIMTNRPFKHSGGILDVNDTLAIALIDRLMHHGEAIVIQRKSYRM